LFGHHFAAIAGADPVAIAGLGLAVVNAPQQSAWGTFTIGFSIPLAQYFVFSRTSLVMLMARS